MPELLTFEKWWSYYSPAVDDETKTHCREAWEAMRRELIQRAERVAAELKGSSTEANSHGDALAASVRCEGVHLVMLVMQLGASQ